MSRTCVLIAAAGLLAACAGGSDGVAPAAGSGDPASCGADSLAPFVGGPVAAAQRQAGQSITRVYEACEQVEGEFLPERVNIVTDADGTVIRLACG